MNSPSYEQAKQVATVLLKKHALPTADQVKDAVQKASMVVEEPDSVDLGLLCRDIESLMNIWVPDGTSLQDSHDHVPWLSDNLFCHRMALLATLLFVLGAGSGSANISR